MSAIRLAVAENRLSDPARITPRMYEEYLALRGRGWVAEVGGVIAGFCYASREDASIWALFMAQGYEGRGLARRLLALAVDWLLEQGAQRITLSTGTGTRADRFYTAQGWMREREQDGDAFFALDADNVRAIRAFFAASRCDALEASR